MKELVFNIIFSLGTVILILVLLLFIVFLISKIYKNMMRKIKYTNTVVAIEFLARKGVDCNIICRTIDFIKRKEMR